MFYGGFELKKYFVIFFIAIVGVAIYLYKYSQNIHVQQFKIHSNLYFKHNEFAKLAEFILANPNVKKVYIDFEGVKADYFEQEERLSKQELKLVGNWLKGFSFYFAKNVNGKIAIQLGSIQSEEKKILVSLHYNSTELGSHDCLSKVTRQPQGSCNEAYNTNWQVSYFWHGKSASR